MQKVTQPVGVVAVAASFMVALASPGVIAAQQAPQVRHSFVYAADKPLKSVHVAGTFNNWDKGASPMRADADGKTWRLELPLPYGRHQYKFVLDGATWVTDPAVKSADDGNGNVNSVLLLLLADYKRPARPDDGVTATSALLHETRIPYRNYDRGSLTLSLRVRPGDISAVQVVANGTRFPMLPAASGGDELYTRYVAHFPWDRRGDLAYTFELTDGERVSRYGPDGLAGAAAKPFVLKAKEFQPFIVPAWVEKSVFYQIFPDRFDNGNKANDPPDVRPWDAKPEWFNRFGGDVAGVRRHLDHLSGLGVSAVYFNPVFQSPSNHRYDAEDFKKIDAQFGTNAEFAGLTRELQKRGIRTVMDFVFNHTATTFAPFADIRQKGEASAYKDWYFIHSYPVRVEQNPNYAAWFGFASMPKLNVLHPPTRDFLLGLVDYWDKEVPLAGMRLDVANEVDPRFWRALRERAKKRDPQMWIVGEVWGDGSPWLGGDQWDSVMNYQFRDACLRFFAEGKTKPSEFVNRLMAVHEGYAPQVSRNLMNLLSSHDTPRFLTVCKGDADLHRLAATVQFTWVGAPSVYYGEEVGMEGGPDPDNRRGMRWDLAKEDNPMLRFYKRLLMVRNASPALQSGNPTMLFADDAAGTLAYSRVLGDDVAVVALNRSNEARPVRIPLPDALRRKGVDLVEALSARKITVGAGDTSLSLTLPAKSAVILLPARGVTLRLIKE
jgi:glycosidase